ncbi:MAG: hypothetical protein ACLSCV_11970 [Acutalibacteraceae bacterium]
MIKTMKNDEYIKLYGLMQSYMSQGKDDVSDKAQKTLDDNGVTQKITVNNLGDTVILLEIPSLSRTLWESMDCFILMVTLILGKMEFT